MGFEQGNNEFDFGKQASLEELTERNCVGGGEWKGETGFCCFCFCPEEQVAFKYSCFLSF